MRFKASLSFLVVLEVIPAVLFLNSQVWDPDVFWHVCAGRWMLEHGKVPKQDPFSFTMPGARWYAHEWLWEIVLAKVHSLAGWRGAGILAAIIAAACAALIWYLARLRTRDEVACGSAVLLWAAGALAFYPPRPQILGYLLFLCYSIALARGRDNPRLLWVLSLLQVVWVNAHGSFILGPFMVLVEILVSAANWRLGRLRAEKGPSKTLFLVLVGVIVASWMNPNGPQMFAYSFGIVGHAEMKNAISEWLSPNFHEGQARWILLPLMGICALWLLFAEEVRLKDLVWVSGTLLMTLDSVRYAPFFAMCLGPVAASVVKRDPRVRPWRPEILNALKAATVALLVAAAVLVGARNPEPWEARYPANAVQFMKSAGLKGRLFNEYAWGGYLLYEGLGPVFIDGRADVYIEGPVFREYMDATALKTDPVAIFNKYRVSLVLIKRGQPLATHLKALPEWNLLYEDEVAALFERTAEKRGESACYFP